VVGWQEKVNRPLPLNEGAYGAYSDEEEREEMESPKPTEEGEETGEEESSRPERVVGRHHMQQQLQQSSVSRVFTLTHPELDPAASHDNTAQGQNISLAALKSRKVKPLGSSVLKQPVTNQLTEAQRKRNRALQSAGEERMAVLAYLGEADAHSHDPRDDHLLCSLTLINGRLLRVQPELNRSHPIRTRHGQQYLCRVGVQPEESEFDKLATKPGARIREEGESEEDGGVELPPVGEYWMHYNINIGLWARQWEKGGKV